MENNKTSSDPKKILIIHSDPNVKEQNMDSYIKLFRSIMANDWPVIRSLFDQKLDFNCSFYIGKLEMELTPLLLAIRSKKMESALTLLDLKLDPNHKGAADFTPISLAIRVGSPDLVRILLENGANLDSSDLHLACSIGILPIVEILINSGVDINSLDNLKQTPLHMAIRSNKVEVVKFLLNHKAINYEMRDIEQFLPIHHACGLEQFEILKLLVRRGANILEELKYSLTPLKIVMKIKKIEKFQDDKMSTLLACTQFVDSLINPQDLRNIDNNEKIIDVLTCLDHEIESLLSTRTLYRSLKNFSGTVDDLERNIDRTISTIESKLALIKKEDSLKFIEDDLVRFKYNIHLVNLSKEVGVPSLFKSAGIVLKKQVNHSDLFSSLPTDITEKFKILEEIEHTLDIIGVTLDSSQN